MDWILGPSGSAGRGGGGSGAEDAKALNRTIEAKRKEIRMASRAIDRQTRGLEKTYQEAIGSTRKLAERGMSHACIRPEIKRAITYRKQQERCFQVKSMLSMADSQLVGIKTTHVLRQTLLGLVDTLELANSISGGVGGLQRTMGTFQREKQRLEIQEDAVNDVFEEIEQEEADDMSAYESQVDATLQRVYEDIGIELSDALRQSISVPTSPLDAQLREQQELLGRLCSIDVPQGRVRQ